SGDIDHCFDILCPRPRSSLVGEASKPSPDRDHGRFAAVAARKGNDVLAVSSADFQRNVVAFGEQVGKLLAQSDQPACPGELHPPVVAMADELGPVRTIK